MNVIKYIFTSLLCLGICSCSIDKSSYVEYINDPDNGLSKVYSSDDWTYTLQYRTPEFMALIEVGNSQVDRSEFSEIVAQYNDLEYYLLTIRSRSSSQNSIELIDHLSFDFKNQISHLSKLDTILPDLYHFENGLISFGEFRFILGFVNRKDDDRRIAIKKFEKDKNIQFSIGSQAIESIPTLEI